MPSLNHKARTSDEYCCQTLFDEEEHRRRQSVAAQKNFIRKEPTKLSQAIFNVLTVVFVALIIWKLLLESPK